MSINSGMDKEDMLHIYIMAYYNGMRWMNLEPIIQSKVNHKEKYKFCILMHIYGV